MPEMYGWQHIAYLIVCFLLMAVGIYLTKKYAKTDKALMRVVKITAGFLLLAIILNRVSICLKNDNWRYMIPDTFCGFSSALFSLTVLFTKKDSGPMHFITYLGFLGGILTMVYPTFISQNASVFYLPTISGLLHHTIMVYLFLLILITGYFKPSIKRWYCLPLGLCFTMTYALVLVDIFGISAMEIGQTFEDIDGLTWFNVGLIFLGLYAIFIVSYEVISKQLKRKSIK